MRTFILEPQFVVGEDFKVPGKLRITIAWGNDDRDSGSILLSEEEAIRVAQAIADWLPGEYVP